MPLGSIKATKSPAPTPAAAIDLARRLVTASNSPNASDLVPNVIIGRADPLRA